MGDYATLLKIIADYFRKYKAYDLPDVCKKYGIECDGNLDPNASKRIYLESGLKKKTFSDLSMVAKQVIVQKRFNTLDEITTTSFSDDLLGNHG